MEYKFQAEVKQVLDIVINSLYTDKEIFVRELVSNASDASEKFRFASLEKGQAIDGDSLKIKISCDAEKSEFSIEDSGIGMTEKEIAENLGTIAHSGSKAFSKALQANGGKLPENIIGQFGVGFYSVFMVADKVEVLTKSENDKAFLFKCDGSENFSIDEAEKPERGTKITAHLKPEYKEFADPQRIREILEKYSAYVDFPISVNEQTVQTRKAIWLKNKSEVSDAEYEDFYKFQTHSYDKPADWLHFKADAPLELNALIYTPSENPEKFGFGKTKPQVSIYSHKVLIDAAPKDLLPEWLRFAKGVIDSADIPLNISRESMQDSALLKKLGKVVVKRYIKNLAEIAKKNPEKFEKIYAAISNFIKEGVAVDFENREALTKLLRYESSLLKAGEKTTFESYVEKMKSAQKDIYYAFGRDRNTIENAPYLEAFKSRGIEVLFMYEPVDVFAMGNLGEFGGKKIVSIDSADIDLSDIPLESENTESSLPEEEVKALCEWIKGALGDKKVKEVSSGKRLVESPAAALNADGLTPQMRAMLKAFNPEGTLPEAAINFEINPKSGLIKNLNDLRKNNEPLAKLVLDQIYDNAMLSAGLLENPQNMVKRLNELMSKIK